MKVKLKAEVIRELLVEKNMILGEFAKALGISSAYLSQLLNHDRGASAAMRKRIQAMFPEVKFNKLFQIDK